MKKLLLIFLMFCCSFQLFSQELKISYFRLSPNDISARTHKVLDLNKQPCALIKVALAGGDASFSENSVIGVPEYKNGEYWVYIPAKTRHLQISRPGYLPLKLSFKEDFNIELESLNTYELRIESPVINQQVVPMIENQYLIMDVSPANAIVYINDIPYETNNGHFEKDLNLGNYSFRVEAPMYESQSGTFTITSDKKMEMAIVLVEQFGYLKINSSPSDATVYIDDEHSGTTPINSVKTAIGTHNIRVVKSGYLVFQQSVSVTRNKTEEINVDLKPTFAAIKINATLKDATILINGREVGKGSWNGNLDAGKYTVEAQCDGYRPVSTVIDVTQGQTQTFTLPELLPYYGIADITSTPSGAKIYIDGKYVDTTPFKTNKIGEGQHEMKAILEGYETMTKKVTVKRDETVKVEFTLNKAQKRETQTSTPQTSKPAASQPRTTSKVRRPAKNTFFISPVASVIPRLNYGGMVGFVHNSLGLFVKYKSNFNSVSSPYECNSNGYYTDGSYFWASGASQRTSTQYTAGATINIADHLYLYAGAGYGDESLYWEDTDHTWTKVNDYSFIDVALTAGAMFRFGFLGLTAGWNGILTDYNDFEVGLSLWF